MNKEFNRITDPRLSAMIDPVSRMAREAGALIMGYHDQAYDIAIKDDASPVTVADKESSNFLVGELSRLTPHIPVVSEENDLEPDNSAYWAIDPLDGTKEFIQKTGGFCVKIALIEKLRPVLGVIYCPVQDVLYYGIEHGQAVRIQGQDAPRIMQTRLVPEKGNLSVLFNRKHADPALYKEHRLALAAKGVFLPVHPKIKPGLPRSMQVAEGLADIHAGTGVKLGSGFAWDIAADDVILTNAGGALLALPSGEKMVYDRPREPVPAYLALGDLRLRTKLFPAPENH